MDISDTLAPKSDQLDAVEMVSPRTFTIERVTRGSDEQPVQIHLSDFPRPWRPGLSMRRVLVSVWGKDASTYVGRRVRLYCDPDVEYAGQAVGGIRIEALSHIDGPKRVPLLIKRGRSAMFTVQPLADEPAAPDYLADARAATTLEGWRAVWARASDAGHLTPALRAELVPLGEALKNPEPEPVTSQTESPPVEDPPADDPEQMAWPEVRMGEQS